MESARGGMLRDMADAFDTKVREIEVGVNGGDEEEERQEESKHGTREKSVGRGARGG